MSRPARIKVRMRTGPGEEPATRHGYLAPPGTRPDRPALVDVRFNPKTECLERVYSLTPPYPDSLLVWWPGPLWTWEDVASIERVPDDESAAEG